MAIIASSLPGIFLNSILPRLFFLLSVKIPSFIYYKARSGVLLSLEYDSSTLKVFYLKIQFYNLIYYQFRFLSKCYENYLTKRYDTFLPNQQLVHEVVGCVE